MLTCINLGRLVAGNVSFLATEDRLQLIPARLVLMLLAAASPAGAADTAAGQRIAEQRCVPCHVVTQAQPRQMSEAPPFQVIAQKYAYSPEMVAFAILDPHPRMNMAISRREAEDLAGYINSLAR
jgi:mono/diheme cytochrome c family protein